MKCPFRKKITKRTDTEEITTVDFMDCIEKDCPFYIASEYDVTKFKCSRC